MEYADHHLINGNLSIGNYKILLAQKQQQSFCFRFVLYLLVQAKPETVKEQKYVPQCVKTDAFSISYLFSKSYL